MFKIILLLALFSTQVFAAPLTTGTGITVVGIANDVSTGTTQNKLVKLTSASKVVIAGTSDVDGIIGVVLNGAGTNGTAQIISSGIALCAFDGTATAGHFVGISSSVAGDCTDVGTSLPLTGQAIGYVLTGGSGAATYTIVMQLRSADGINGILSAAHGGTGVNNGSNNITLSGALTILGGTSITPTSTGIGVWAAGGNITGSNTPLISVAAAPSTPSASTARIFVDSTDKRLHDINDAGAIGTTVVANTGASNNFLTSISAAGVVARAQPAFTNISGTIATGQVSGSYTGITGVGTLTAGATGAGFTLAFGSSTLTGQIPLANGGTNANLTASNGGIFYSTGSAAAILAGTVTAGQCLLSGSSTAPTWGSCSTGSGTVTSAVIASGTGMGTFTGTCTITTTGTCTIVGSAKQLPGTITNDNASAGNLGEYISSTVLIGSEVSLTTGTATDITSISLTAGDWDVSGLIWYDVSGATSTVTSSWVSSTATTIPVPPAGGVTQTRASQTASFSQAVGGRVRFSLSATTSINLGTFSVFTGGTIGAYGTIYARRVR